MKPDLSQILRECISDCKKGNYNIKFKDFKNLHFLTVKVVCWWTCGAKAPAGTWCTVMSVSFPLWDTESEGNKAVNLPAGDKLWMSASVTATNSDRQTGGGGVRGLSWQTSLPGWEQLALLQSPYHPGCLLCSHLITAWPIFTHWGHEKKKKQKRQEEEQSQSKVWIKQNNSKSRSDLQLYGRR